LRAGWSDRVISFRSQKGVENNPHAQARPNIRLKQTLFANRSSISPMSKGRGRQTGKQGYSSDSSPNEGDSGRIHALFPRCSLKHEGASQGREKRRRWDAVSHESSIFELGLARNRGERDCHGLCEVGRNEYCIGSCRSWCRIVLHVGCNGSPAPFVPR
jgi:hypothetical protein